MNSYYNPVHTFLEKGSIDRVPELVQELCPEGGRVLVLAWSETVFELPAIAGLEKLPGIALQKRVFLASNPTLEQLFSLYRETADFCPQAVIAVGGGSVMDVGKSLAAVWKTDPVGGRPAHHDSGKGVSDAAGEMDRRAHHGGNRKRGHLWGDHLGPVQRREAFAGIPAELRICGRCGSGSDPADASFLLLAPLRWMRWRMRWRAAGPETPTRCPGRWRCLRCGPSCLRWTAFLPETEQPVTACRGKASWQGSPSAIPEPRPATPFPIRSPCITGFHTERRSAFFWLPFSGSTGKTRSGRRKFFLGLKDETELEERIHAILRAASIPDSLRNGRWKERI